MNVALLQKAKEAMLSHADRVDMLTWCAPKSGFGAGRTSKLLAEDNCGTVGCIAGFVCSLSGKKIVVKDSEDSRIEKTAMILLDLNRNQSDLLFSPYSWPDDLYDRLLRVEPRTRLYAELVAERIDRFIAEEGTK